VLLLELGGRVMRGRLDLRAERGLTLPELLVAMAIGLATIAAVLGLITFTMQRTGATRDRIQATQAGRIAMDRMTRDLRSQVCRDATTPAIAAASSTAVTFYVDLTSGALPQPQRVQRRVIRYDAATRRLIQDVYRPTGATPIAFPANPSVTSVLASNVVPASATTPLFAYYAYTQPAAGTIATLTVPVTSPTTTAQLGSIARIDINFAVLAGRATTLAAAPASLTLSDQVTVRSADPNDRNPRPACD
jgi:prepilin-type N-terminal cleavage/methylation domain-containing protein